MPKPALLWCFQNGGIPWTGNLGLTKRPKLFLNFCITHSIGHFVLLIFFPVSCTSFHFCISIHCSFTACYSSNSASFPPSNDNKHQWQFFQACGWLIAIFNGLLHFKKQQSWVGYSGKPKQKQKAVKDPVSTEDLLLCRLQCFVHPLYTRIRRIPDFFLHFVFTCMLLWFSFVWETECAVLSINYI